MIDATQLPRAPSAGPSKNARDGDSTGNRESSAKRTPGAEDLSAGSQVYPAKQLTFVGGRYRAVDHLK